MLLPNETIMSLLRFIRQITTKRKHPPILGMNSRSNLKHLRHQSLQALYKIVIF